VSGKQLTDDEIISQISFAGVVYVAREDLALTPTQAGRAWLEFFLAAVKAAKGKSKEPQ
jgi:hypothetical protein